MNPDPKESLPREILEELMEEGRKVKIFGRAADP